MHIPTHRHAYSMSVTKPVADKHAIASVWAFVCYHQHVSLFSIALVNMIFLMYDC